MLTSSDKILSDDVQIIYRICSPIFARRYKSQFRLGMTSGVNCCQWGMLEYVQIREKNKHNRAFDCGCVGTSLHTGGSIPHTEHHRRLKEDLERELEYVQIREKNKHNRASDCGCVGTSLHTGGSIPHTEHHRRLKEDLEREPTMLELHQRPHQCVKNKQCVDQRSENVHSEYVRIIEHTLASQGEGSSSQPSDFNTWREAAGEKKKRRMYGLGAVAYTSSSSHSSHSMDSSGSTLEMIIRRYIDSLEQSHLEKRKYYEKQIRELREEISRSKLRRMKKKHVATSGTEEGGGRASGRR